MVTTYNAMEMKKTTEETYADDDLLLYLFKGEFRIAG